MEDRRKYIRFGAGLSAKCGYWGSLFPKKSDCVVKDMSREGLRMSSASMIPKRDKYELEVFMPNGSEPFIMVAKPVWTRQIDVANYDTGLQLTSIKPQDRNRVMDHLSEEWIKSKSRDS